MLLGVFPDVRGNLDFLEKGLDRLKARGAEKLVFLGDVVQPEFPKK